MPRAKVYEDAVTLSLRLPKKLKDDLKTAAERLGMTSNELAVLGITTAVHGPQQAEETIRVAVPVTRETQHGTDPVAQHTTCKHPVRTFGVCRLCGHKLY